MNMPKCKLISIERPRWLDFCAVKSIWPRKQMSQISGGNCQQYSFLFLLCLLYFPSLFCCSLLARFNSSSSSSSPPSRNEQNCNCRTRRQRLGTRFNRGAATAELAGRSPPPPPRQRPNTKRSCQFESIYHASQRVVSIFSIGAPGATNNDAQRHFSIFSSILLLLLMLFYFLFVGGGHKVKKRTKTQPLRVCAQSFALVSLQ